MGRIPTPDHSGMNYRSALREVSMLLRGAVTEELIAGSLGPHAQLLLAQVLKDAHDVVQCALNGERHAA